MFILKYAFICIAVAQITAKRPNKDYLLPKFCKPLEYNVHIFVPLESMEENYNVFHGQEMIKFYVNESTDYIALHSHHVYLRLISVSLEGKVIPRTSYNVDNETDILKINLKSSIDAGKTYFITIDYTGVLSTTDLYGFYKRSSKDHLGKKRFYLASMLAPTHARRVFPCFDEPAWKAIFTFTFTLPWEYGIRFNTAQGDGATFFPDEGEKIVPFEPTPKMSTYLVAFIISSFSCSSVSLSPKLAETRICSRKITFASRELAEEFAPRLLNKMNELTDYNYETVLQHLDHVAVPHFDSGAMENWGLILYLENCLLWNENSNVYMQRVVTTIAHEIAHQWFGNLVTLEWWSDIILNEGFGAYFEYFLTHEVLPEWELDKQFVIEKLHVALTNDALGGAPVLQSNCYTQAEIKDRFHQLNYDKGSSILWMIEHFMEKENFFDGLQYYLKTYQFKTARAEDLWNALNRSVDPSISKLPANFSTVMEKWVKLPGFPLITVSIHGDKVTVSQKRYPFSDKDESTKWYVPISYSLSVDPDSFNDTTPKLWLTPLEAEVNITLPENCSWIIVNNQRSAYYRVIYDDTLLANLQTALLKDNFDDIDEINRAGIVDDLFNLAKLGLLRYSEVFEAIKFLKNDTSYYPWYAAFTGFDYLLTKVGYDSAAAVKVKKTISDLMPLVLESVRLWNIYPQEQEYSLKQAMVHEWACTLEYGYCRTIIPLLFRHYKQSGRKPMGVQRRTVYCHGIKYSDDKCDWDFLWDVYSKTDSEIEKEDLLYGLTCTRDEVILKKLLHITIDDKKKVPYYVAAEIYSNLYKGYDKRIKLVLNFFKENYQAIEDRYGEVNFGHILEDVATRIYSTSQLDIYIDIVDLASPNVQIYGDRGLIHIDGSLNFIEVINQDLVEEAITSKSTTISGAYWFLFISVFFILYY